MERLLNPAQAKGVYDAMCALNNVNGRIGQVFVTDWIAVKETSSGPISVQEIGNPPLRTEWYDNQLAFAQAYNLG